MPKHTPTTSKGKAKPPEALLTHQISAAYTSLDAEVSKAEASVKATMAELSAARALIRAFVDEVTR